jgi:hypothetical protein
MAMVVISSYGDWRLEEEKSGRYLTGYIDNFHSWAGR